MKRILASAAALCLTCFGGGAMAQIYEIYDIKDAKLTPEGVKYLTEDAKPIGLLKIETPMQSASDFVATPLPELDLPF